MVIVIVSPRVTVPLDTETDIWADAAKTGIATQVTTSTKITNIKNFLTILSPFPFAVARNVEDSYGLRIIYRIISLL